MLEIRLLGAVDVIIDRRSVDIGHARQASVLAALLIDVNRWVSIDRLVERVWGECPPARSNSALYSYVSRLRRVLSTTEDFRIIRKSGGYIAASDPLGIDMHLFRSLLDRARKADDHGQALSLLDQALELWRGEAFATLSSQWLETVRESLDRERFAAELDRNDLVLRCGGHAAILADLVAQAAAYPLDERLAGQLILALHRCGRTADALSVYRRTAQQLADELGVDPGPRLQQLELAILRNDTAHIGGHRHHAVWQAEPVSPAVTS